jgi:hypothetical protein
VLGPNHVDRLLGELRWLHAVHQAGLQVALGQRPLEEGVQTPVAVVGGRRLPAGQLVGDELLDVLAFELAGEERLAMSVAVGGEQPDGVGVGLDRPRALVLGLQGAPEAPVEDQKMPSGSCRPAGTGWAYDIGPLIRVWWSGWLGAACSA